ncbi:MAG: RNA polymerase sigma factor [Bacillota bacterium]
MLFVTVSLRWNLSGEQAQVWQQLYRMTYRYFVDLGLTREDAEVLTQETLLSTYLHLDAIGEGKLRAYVLAVARSKYADFLERRRRDYWVIQQQCRAAARICLNKDDIHSKQIVEDAVRKLKPAERALVFMKYQMGMSAKEIAAALGITADSVKTALWRARKGLKLYLNNEEER